MAKNHAADGRQVGREMFLVRQASGFDLRVDESVVEHEAALEARFCMSETKRRSDDFFDGFVQGFVAAWRRAYSDLPDVKAATKHAWLSRTLADMALTSTAKLGEFAASVTQNPGYAFEWADKMFTTAAQHELAVRMTAWLEKTGVDGVQGELEAMVLRDAIHPSKSTSDCSNIMHRERLAASAALLQALRDRF